MRLHFRERPWDLIVAVGYVTFVAATVLAVGGGNPLAILLVLFVPGYVLVAVLFPENREVDWIERIALSFGVSIAVVPLLGLFLILTPWGIRFIPLVGTIAVFTVGLGYAAYWRRMRLPPDKRLSLTVEIAVPNWTEYGGLDKGLTIALSASIIVAGGTLAYVVLTPPPGETFTQFYILGPGGNASVYPTALNISQPGSVILGIASHEATTVTYNVRVDLIGVRLVYNTTSGFNETVELNRTTWSTFNVTLADGQNWTQPYTFRITDPGLWKVQFLLFKDGDFSSAYHELHLFVRVQ